MGMEELHFRNAPPAPAPHQNEYQRRLERCLLNQKQQRQQLRQQQRQQQQEQQEQAAPAAAGAQGVFAPLPAALAEPPGGQQQQQQQQWAGGDGGGCYLLGQFDVNRFFAD